MWSTAIQELASEISSIVHPFLLNRNVAHITKYLSLKQSTRFEALFEEIDELDGKLRALKHASETHVPADRAMASLLALTTQEMNAICEVVVRGPVSASKCALTNSLLSLPLVKTDPVVDLHMRHVPEAKNLIYYRWASGGFKVPMTADEFQTVAFSHSTNETCKVAVENGDSEHSAGIDQSAGIFIEGNLFNEGLWMPQIATKVILIHASSNAPSTGKPGVAKSHFYDQQVPAPASIWKLFTGSTPDDGDAPLAIGYEPTGSEATTNGRANGTESDGKTISDGNEWTQVKDSASEQFYWYDASGSILSTKDSPSSVKAINPFQRAAASIDIHTMATLLGTGVSPNLSQHIQIKMRGGILSKWSTFLVELSGGLIIPVKKAAESFQNVSLLQATQVKLKDRYVTVLGPKGTLVEFYFGARQDAAIWFSALETSRLIAHNATKLAMLPEEDAARWWTQKLLEIELEPTLSAAFEIKTERGRRLSLGPPMPLESAVKSPQELKEEAEKPPGADDATVNVAKHRFPALEFIVWDASASNDVNYEQVKATLSDKKALSSVGLIFCSDGGEAEWKEKMSNTQENVIISAAPTQASWNMVLDPVSLSELTGTIHQAAWEAFDLTARERIERPLADGYVEGKVQWWKQMNSSKEKSQILLRNLYISSIIGNSTFHGAIETAEKYSSCCINMETAVASLIKWQSSINFGTGFVTGFGGFAAMPITVPTAMLATWMTSARLAFAIAHVCGHDIWAPKICNGVLHCIVGGKTVEEVRASVWEPPMAPEMNQESSQHENSAEDNTADPVAKDSSSSAAAPNEAHEAELHMGHAFEETQELNLILSTNDECNESHGSGETCSGTNPESGTERVEEGSGDKGAGDGRSEKGSTQDIPNETLELEKCDLYQVSSRLVFSCLNLRLKSRYLLISMSHRFLGCPKMLPPLRFERLIDDRPSGE